MKVSILDGGITEWFLAEVGGSDPAKLRLIADKEGWDAKDIELGITLNGVEFLELGDIFNRLDDHIQNMAKKLSNQDTLTLAKIEAIQNILNAKSVEEIEQ